jgi:anaerobic nitric oxide reductase transcription regulator
LAVAVTDCQRQLILAALAASGDNWAEAARRLATDASNLHRLARRLGLKSAKDRA